MSFLDDPGDLAEVPLAAVLLEVLNQRATGVLTVEHGGGASRVFLRDGSPVGAQSYSGFRPLGQVLLSAGLIDMEVLDRSLSEMARSGRQQGDVLVSMGVVAREEVDRALSEQQATYLTEIAGLTSGRFRFDPTAPVPAWTAGIRIAPLKAIVEALERPQAMPLVFSALQPAAEAALVLASGYRQLAQAFGWTEVERALVDRLQGGIRLDAFLSAPGVTPERARAVIAALLLLGLVQPRPPDAVVETVPGIVVDLADLAGVPIEPTPAPTATPVPGRPPPPPSTARRSDPEEARRRRQRLLQRAMQNMGVGPLSGQRPSQPAAARPPAPAAAAPAAAPPPRAAAGSPEAELRRALQEALPRARLPDLFERLGVARTATRDQVKAAYFRLAKQLHPDRFAAPGLADLAGQVKDLFAAVNEAYEVLSDDRKRAEYLARAPKGGPNEEDRRLAEIDFQKAEACARTRDHARARGFFEAALRGDPRPAWQLAYAAALLQEPGGDRARVKALLDAAQRDPPHAEKSSLLLAQLARDAGDAAEEERQLQRALQANPQSPDAQRELQLLKARQGGKGSSPSGFFRRR